jgi:hypothetical protein
MAVVVSGFEIMCARHNMYINRGSSMIARMLAVDGRSPAEFLHGLKARFHAAIMLTAQVGCWIAAPIVGLRLIYCVWWNEFNGACACIASSSSKFEPTEGASGAAKAPVRSAQSRRRSWSSVPRPDCAPETQGQIRRQSWKSQRKLSVNDERGVKTEPAVCAKMNC